MSPDTIIPANTKIEMLVVEEGRLVRKMARIRNAVKKYIFEKAASKRHPIAGYQILSS
jgi:hypothetical protein